MAVRADMFKKIFAINVKGLQIAFFAGTAVGSAFGCAAGIGLGVGLGLLLAPKSGKEMRTEIADKVCAAVETAKEQGTALKDKTMNAYETVSKQVSDKISSAA